MPQHYLDELANRRRRPAIGESLRAVGAGIKGEKYAPLPARDGGMNKMMQSALLKRQLDELYPEKPKTKIISSGGGVYRVSPDGAVETLVEPTEKAAKEPSINATEKAEKILTETGTPAGTKIPGKDVPGFMDDIGRLIGIGSKREFSPTQTRRRRSAAETLGIQEFATAQEAAAANLPVGTQILINGRVVEID